MNEYLIGSYLKHPLMRVEDFVKQIFQAEYGAEHLLGADTQSRINDECERLDESECEPLFEQISEDMARVNLAPYKKAGYDTAILAEAMQKAGRKGSAEGLDVRLGSFSGMLGSRVDLPVFSAKNYISEYAKNGYGPVRHSTSYRMNYHPHYRVVAKKHAVLLPLLVAIEELLYRKLNVITAVDGNCGSGKTFYADVLSDYYNFCTVIHCDDFFLPPDMRTESRLSEFGGNLHYERLFEVLEKVRQDKPFTYEKYDCLTNSFNTVQVQPKRLVIVEGAYSLCPSLNAFYDAKAVFSVSESEQTRRLTEREGKEGFQAFKDKWIPLENAYFNRLDRSGTVRISTDGIKY